MHAWLRTEYAHQKRQQVVIAIQSMHFAQNRHDTMRRASHRSALRALTCSTFPICRLSTAAASSSRSSIPAPLKTKTTSKPPIRLDFRRMRDNSASLQLNADQRGTKVDMSKIARLYDRSVELRDAVNKVNQRRNQIAKTMKDKSLSAETKAKLVEEGKQLKTTLTSTEAEETRVLAELEVEGLKVPNDTHSKVPVGTEEKATQLELVGSKPSNSDGAPLLGHMELGQRHGLFNMEAAGRVAGSRFYYLTKEAALLELALVNWTMQKLYKKGFTPVLPPDLARGYISERCGFQPKDENHSHIYHIEGSDLTLSGTAEIPLAGLYADSLLSQKDVPLRLAGFSHAFRTEVASGSATAGLYRVHQFSKVEMFAICPPEASEAMHAEIVAIQREIFSELGLHFRILDMPTRDLGSSAFRKIDMEAWMPSRNGFGEISSASNCTDYQSRRLNIRVREHVKEGGADGGSGSVTQSRFVHTLNGTACAVPRTIIAILEQLQLRDGSISVPSVLQPFMMGISKIPSQPPQPASQSGGAAGR